MLKSRVEKSGRNFKVFTSKVTPFGFINTRETDKFGTIEQANKKSNELNEIWGLLAKGEQMRMAGVR